MNIDQNIIDEIINKSDIVDIIGKHLKLKRSGTNYFACCPFHNEKTASFSINANKQFFHCFGCGESGNVITFVMKYNGFDFVDAVKSIAAQIGVHIPENSTPLSKEEVKKRKEHKASLNDTINQVVRFYQNNLVNSSVASHYLLNRGLSNEIVHNFLLGYAPNNQNPLASLFNNYTENSFLQDAGLVITSDNGKIFDRFRERIMFPIRNVKGEVIAFGGRITAHGEPKYLNSPETPLFNKSQELYGLFEAQKQIRDKNQVIVVEGYMDVIAMFQFGVENVVATMGTAITEEQIKKLIRLCDDIYYCFDGDTAGFKAAWRALERSLAHITDTKAIHFVFLPEGEDPDSFLRKFGRESFIQYQKNHSLSMSNFLLNQLSSQINIGSTEGKAKLISQAKPYLEKITATALKVVLKKQLADLVELAPNVLESILNNRSRYAFYGYNLNKVKPLDKASSIPMLNTIELIISNAINNLDWVINYKLPEEISTYSREIQELIILLDYVDNHGSTSLNEIKQKFELITLNLDKILLRSDHIKLCHDDFIKTLDRLFGRVSNKAIKIPKIVMKNDAKE